MATTAKISKEPKATVKKKPAIKKAGASATAKKPAKSSEVKAKNTEGKTLLIVESPTKARTISGFISKDFVIESSYGHIRDLPKSRLGIDTEHDFEPEYIIPIKAKKNVNVLKREAEQAREVVLASDEDREGEAIAWHLYQALGLDKKDPASVKRIAFHEITESAIKDAIAHPREININMVDAQQARRVLDRLVGYKLSPFLWKNEGTFRKA